MRWKQVTCHVDGWRLKMAWWLKMVPGCFSVSWWNISFSAVLQFWNILIPKHVQHHIMKTWILRITCYWRWYPMTYSEKLRYRLLICLKRTIRLMIEEVENGLPLNVGIDWRYIQHIDTILLLSNAPSLEGVVGCKVPLCVMKVIATTFWLFTAQKVRIHYR